MATMNATETLTLAVTGMTCGNCKRHVEEALASVEGVSSAEVDLAGGRAAVTYDPASAAPAQLLDAVREAGYGAEVASPAKAASLPIAAAASCGCCAIPNS